MSPEQKPEVTVYRAYYFYDGHQRVYLDWGETGLIPNPGDAFDHPTRDGVSLRLGDIKWASGPKECQ